MDFGAASGNVFAIYDQFLVPAVFGPWTPKLLDLAQVGEGDHVLDVACGTGVVARLAAQRVGSSGVVVGSDLTPSMLDIARSVAPVSGAASIAWREGDACALPLADAQFDVALCQLGLMFFPDQPKAMREMHRVLVPGGRMALLVWRAIERSPGYAALSQALGSHISDESAAIMHTPFVFGDSDETLRALVNGAGFREVRVQADIGFVHFRSPEEFVRLYIAGTPLAHHFENVDETTQVSLIQEVDSALRPYVSAEGLEFPIEGHLVAAKK